MANRQSYPCCLAVFTQLFLSNILYEVHNRGTKIIKLITNIQLKSRRKELFGIIYNKNTLLKPPTDNHNSRIYNTYIDQIQ